LGGKQDYEWQSAGITPFGATFSIKKPEFETANGHQMTCHAGSGMGTFGLFAARITSLTFTGCKFGKGGAACTTGDEAPGVIVTHELNDLTDWQNQNAPEVLMRLFGAEEEPFAEFKCGGLNVVITGSVLVPWPDPSKSDIKYDLKYRQTNGTQEFTKYSVLAGEAPTREANLKWCLECGTPENVGVEMPFEITDGGKFELRVM